VIVGVKVIVLDGEGVRTPEVGVIVFVKLGVGVKLADIDGVGVILLVGVLVAEIDLVGFGEGGGPLGQAIPLPAGP
jgi:hypothetical protein